MSDNEIYLLIKYIKSVLWRVVKRLSYIEDAWYLKVNVRKSFLQHFSTKDILLHVVFIRLCSLPTFFYPSG